jgi:hypothetical protein
VTRVSSLIGAHQTAPIDSTLIQSSVDELYRLSVGIQATRGMPWDSSKVWMNDKYKGVDRHAAYGAVDGRESAFVILPESSTTIIILTNDPSADARGMAEKILDQVLAARK